MTLNPLDDDESDFALSADAWDALLEAAGEVCDLLEDDKEIILAGDADCPLAVVDLMPPGFRLRYNGQFVEKLEREARGLLDRLRTARLTGSACPYATFLNTVAEEMLMARIIDLSRQKSFRSKVKQELEELEEASFEDRDFEWLYDLRHDGITDDPRIAEQIGFVNLKFEDWFSPFREKGDGVDQDSS